MPVSTRNRSTNLILPAALSIAIATMGLAACGGSGGSDGGDGGGGGSSPVESSAGGKALNSQNGVTLASGDWALHATASASLMPGYSNAPLSFRMLTGWVNEEAAAQAAKEADPRAQRQQGLASFGLFTLEVAAGTAAPGTYRLTPEVAGADTAEVVIPLSRDAGLEGKFTSQSGTLTIKTVQVEMGQYASKVVAVEGSFDGMFSDAQGTTRPFNGSFRSAAE